MPVSLTPPELTEPEAGAQGGSPVRALHVPRAMFALLTVVGIAVSAVALGQWAPVAASTGTTREFTLTARQFAYTPERIRVTQGDYVILHLVPKDVAHGIFLDGYGLEARALPGGAATIEFVADRAGQFRFRCSVTCGALHPFMIGQLNVESGVPFTNAPFLLSAAAALIIASGSVVYAFRVGEHS